MRNRQKMRKAFDRLVGPLIVCSPPIWGYPLDYFVGMNKLVELHHLTNSARFALWTAFDTTHDVKDTRSLIWLRTMYWSNAVLWFNAVEDVLCQVIWLTLDLHGIPKTSKTWLQKAMKKCNYTSVRDSLQRLESREVLPIMEAYHNMEEVRQVRAWANNLKHWGQLDFEELDLYWSGIVYVHKNTDGEIVFSTRDILPMRINFPSALETLIRLHPKVVQMVEQVKATFAPDRYYYSNEDGALEVFRGRRSDFNY